VERTVERAIRRVTGGHADLDPGLSNAEIAEQLRVSESTVKTHVNHVFAKIEARDRAQAVTYAFRNGIAT
jgi:DNA-binding NarL/FixJ family response regulator